MDFQPTEDQQALIDALQVILADNRELPQAERLNYSYYNAALQHLLDENGFLDAARTMGPVEATLIIINAASVPSFVETAATGLIAGLLLPEEKLEGPIALLSGDTLSKPQRNLPIVCHAFVDLGADVAVLPIAADAIERVDSVYAYPYGRFRSPPSLSGARTLPGAGAKLRQWRRVAIAAEIAGAAQAAIAFTLDYVKQRKVFGHPIGAFQVVQHRLAQCHFYAMATYYLALRAAWSGDPIHANLAVTHAQQGVQKVVYDLHQFNGAMGVTAEHTLHFWTYRMRALQSEVGGVYEAALDVADQMWGAPDAAARAKVRA